MTRVIGPPRSRRRGWWYGGATLATALFFVVFFVASSGAVVSGSPSGFESSDGNMVLNATTTGTNTDWNCFVGSDNFQAGTPDTKCKVKTGATQVTADANGEISWVNGQKFDTLCPALAVNNNPPKDEFTNVASYNETAANLDVFFYGATIRATANGNSSGDVEFNQGTGNGTTSAGCRTAGDRLMAYDFLNGGTGIDFHVLTWITADDPTTTTIDESTLGGNSGTCFVKQDSMPCWGAHVITPDSSEFDGASNATAAITAANNGMSGTALAINQFAEFGINLSQALNLSGQCISFPQEVWESRSSGSSFTSNPQDIEIEHQTLQNCGTITIIKHTSPRGLNQAFNFHQDVSGTADFSLNDNGNTSADNSANTKTFSNVTSGTYHVSEDTVPAGFAFASASCTTTGGSSVTNGTDDTTHIGLRNLTLTGGGSITCTYTNNQQLGAIKITKTSSKAAHTALTGAHFRICTNDGPYTAQNPCAAAATGSDDLTVTNSDGTVCVANLAFATYYVSEKSAPTGYSIDDTSVHQAVVSANTTCSGSPVALTFRDTPLTDVVVTATSEVTGGTASRITCTDSSSANIGNSPTPSASTFGDPATMTANGLAPGTYSCTVGVER
jgi:hypothetical protein